MSYIVSQYNKTPSVTDVDSTMMTLMSDVEAKRISISSNSVAYENTGYIPFFDECATSQINFKDSEYYYFHGKVLKTGVEQIFYIKLCEYKNPLTNDSMQYVKTVTVPPKTNSVDIWHDVEFIFSPIATRYNSILFQLSRTSEDYMENARIPVIVYEEISIINNLISSKIGKDVSLVKIGVQSRPGLLMCINGEEIRTGRTGVYEIKDGVLYVSFFAVITNAKDNATILNTALTEAALVYTQLNKEAAAKVGKEREASFCSKSICNYSKTRVIDSFTLDYMYNKEEE